MKTASLQLKVNADSAGHAHELAPALAAARKAPAAVAATRDDWEDF